MTWAVPLAAFVGALSVQAVALAWSVPFEPLGLGVVAANGVVAAVLAAPILLGLAAVAPAWRMRVVPASWPALAVSGLVTCLGEGVTWSSRIALSAFVVALAMRGRMRRPLHLAFGLIGLLPLSLATLRPASGLSALRAVADRPSKLGAKDRARIGDVLADLRGDHRAGSGWVRNPDGALEPPGASLRFAPDPWYVWRVPGWTDLFVVFEGRSVDTLTTEVSGCVSVVGERGAAASELIWMPPHIQIDDASIATTTSRGWPVVDVIGHANAGGKDVRHQLYAVSPSRIVLARVESSSGRAVRSSFGVATIGPGVELGSRACEQDLLWGDSLCVLRALEWLGRAHHGSEAEAVAALRESPRVKERLERLAASPDPWLRDAARLALDRARDDD